MSDSRIYELEDIVWELGDNDDHIVPQPGVKTSRFSAECDRSKRPRLQLSCGDINVDKKSASDNVNQRKEGTSFSPVKKEKEIMMDGSPQSCSSSGCFSASVDGDSNGKNSCIASDEERTFDHRMTSSNMDPTGNGLCTDDPILEDNKLYQYELNNATHTESDLDFFGNSLDDKESDDLLYYGWNEIENFEDVDRMFRNCDSTFGIDIDNNVELGWFSNSHAMEGSNDAIKSSFNFSGCDTTVLDGVTEQQDVYELNNSNLLADENDEKLTPVTCKGGSQRFTANSPSAVMNACYVNESRVVSDIDSDSLVHSHVSQPKQHKSSEGKRKGRPSENGVSFIHFDSLNQAPESSHSLNFQCSFLSENHQQKEASDPRSAVLIPLINSNNIHSSKQGLPSITSSLIKSEDNCLPSISPGDSSYGSNQMQSVDSTHDVSLQNPSVTRNKKRDRPLQRRLSRHPAKSNLKVQIADPDSVCLHKLCDDENEVEGQSEVDNEVGIATELDSSNMQESSSMSSVLDEVSIDASSFQQLQNVMEKLDVRTKLCIRDSLYRLARSAERRHKCDNPNKVDKDDKNTNGALLSDGTNKCTGFMDMETDTNPIDRSIAHLLFHRPSDPSATTLLDTLPVKSHTMGQACNHSPIIAEKKACQEETTSANGEAVH